MRVLLVVSFALLATATYAQQVDKIAFFGPGVSSSLANGTKSVSAIGGGKLVFHLGAGGWFSQLSCSASFVEPQVAGAKAYWSTRPTISLGYRFRGGKSRFSLFDGFGEARNKLGDFLPTAVGGVIIKIKGRWGRPHGRESKLAILGDVNDSRVQVLTGHCYVDLRCIKGARMELSPRLDLFYRSAMILSVEYPKTVGLRLKRRR